MIITLPGDRIRFITKFDDFVDPEIPYMYHCHNLFHEDAGMMGQFIVVEGPYTGAPEDRYILYPNPTQDQVKIMDQDGLFEEIHTIQMVDAQGKIVQSTAIQPGKRTFTFAISDLLQGVYSVQLLSNTSEPSHLKLLKLR